MEYDEEDYLALSGIQHFAFCRRQWALVHIEQIWRENLFTTLGEIMHERAHDEGLRERRGDLLVVRGLRVHSRRLGISGECDVVEFHADERGISLAGEQGKWNVVPIEYKRGRPKRLDADRLQLCAQALCLEEMLGCTIPKGALYYGSSKSREVVLFSKELRSEAEVLCREMHGYYARRYVPHVKYGKRCLSCSLFESCMPKSTHSVKGNSVDRYIDSMLENACMESEAQ